MKHLRVGRLLIILGGMVSVATFYTNCSPSSFQAAHSTHQSSTGFGCTKCFDKPASPITMMTSFQIFSTMLNVTEQNGNVDPQGSLKREYDARSGSLADNDNIAGVNAPLQMAATAVAGEVCNSLLTREQALGINGRKFFNGVNFGANLAGNTSSAYASSTEAMAQAYWGRSMTPDEMKIMNDFYADFVSSFGTQGAAAEQVRATRKLYLSACSAMLSSFDAISN